MSVSETIKTNLSYGKEIVESGIEGAAEARKTALESAENADMVTAAAQESWQAAALGAMVGAILGVVADDRKPVRGVIAGGLLGLAAGFAGSFAWKTRPLTGAMAREAGRRIGAVRDEHWLAENPVNYG
ncbi:MAG: hypothetical protein IH602_06820 [Bryobacteraceae bacterium]|jgi:hypothetical protein|nr:hypothetical protein [Bryobacteraceae bacterium]